MKNYIIKTKDPIVQDIIQKMDSRSVLGLKKYGQSMMTEIETGEKDLKDFIVDVQEELMDAILYLESAKHCLQIATEEAALKILDSER